ncbi:MAG: glycoside hydrolase family 2 TIM barrel-domain containing protein [Victivallaceae bacterium]|nr:glycoside hydrolase family 2 TIM barrel-domain containing protein [Victivallaceae bacterium]
MTGARPALSAALPPARGLARTINVPFCPESPLSGVGCTDFIEAMFYHRKLEIPVAWRGKRIMLNFGAVDYEATIFIDGVEAGGHQGGGAPFSIDITNLVSPDKTSDLVVWVKDELRSNLQPHGKQSNKLGSYECFYTRVTGIWQTVWMEAISVFGLKSCLTVPDFDSGAFVFKPEFYSFRHGMRFAVKLFADGKLVGEGVSACALGVSLVVAPEKKRAWSPDDPFLYEIVYEVRDISGEVLDKVTSYAGLRKIHIEGDRLFLNNEPLFLRFVLDQGYWPDGVWTAPSDEMLKQDVERTLAAGFNGARLHQRVFEERSLYWADKLGLLVFAENASWGSYAQSPLDDNSPLMAESAFRFCSEWRQIVAAKINHPCIIGWTPLNESTPLHPEKPHYRHFVSEVYDLTHEMDQTRPCCDVSGFYQVKSDLWTVHIYAPDAKELKKRLHPDGAKTNIRSGETGYCGQPYLCNEFGGFKYVPAERRNCDSGWGYNNLDLPDGDALLAKIEEQIEVLLADPMLSGYCYTQLTDVEQEKNGLYNYDRSEKIPEERLRAVFGREPEPEKKREEKQK